MTVIPLKFHIIINLSSNIIVYNLLKQIVPQVSWKNYSNFRTVSYCVLYNLTEGTIVVQVLILNLII